METTYLYSVHPRKIIKDLPIPPIRAPKSLYLTKEQVKVCLKSATVYRRFANEDKIVRVLISNVDRLHNEKFMTEEEYEKYKESLANDSRGSVINDTPFVDVKAKEFLVDEQPKEEKVEETTVEEVKEEPAEVVEEVESVEQPQEEKVEEEPTEVKEETVEEKKETQKNNYGGRNNKHRK